jgi:hypothetical protein
MVGCLRVCLFSFACDAQSLHHTHHRHRIPQVTAARRRNVAVALRLSAIIVAKILMWSCKRTSLSSEERAQIRSLEPGRGQLGVAHCVLDIFVAEVGLERARVVSLGRQRKPAGMP